MRLVPARHIIWLLPALALLAIGFYSGYQYASRPATVKSADAGATTDVIKNVKPATATVRVDSGLSNQLLLANQEISQLEARNQALAQQIEQMNLPISRDTTYPELLARVDRLPALLIRQQLRHLFDDDYVETIEDPHEFARELIEVALDQAPEQTDDSLQIAFSLSPTWGLRNFSQLDKIDEFDQVFAHFVANRNFANLIVRWQHLGTGEILRFGPLQLADNQVRYQSLKPSQGWSSGNYQVSVYDLESDKRLVGTGSFIISGVNPQTEENATSQPDMDVINDLLSSGAASPKSF